MIRTVLGLTAFALPFAVGLGVGMFFALGVVTFIWGADAQAMRPAGVPIDRNHPSFWLFGVLMAPGMLIGMTGAFALLYWPLCHFWPWLADVIHGPNAMTMHRFEQLFASAWARQMGEQIERLEREKAKQADAEV